MKRFFLPFLLVGLFLSGCGEDESEIQTIQDELEDIEGKKLSDEEINELLKKAKYTCQLDDSVLKILWEQLDEDEFVFQDFVFTHQCTEKRSIYTAATGRL